MLCYVKRSKIVPDWSWVPCVKPCGRDSESVAVIRGSRNSIRDLCCAKTPCRSAQKLRPTPAQNAIVLELGGPNREKYAKRWSSITRRSQRRPLKMISSPELSPKERMQLQALASARNDRSLVRFVALVVSGKSICIDSKGSPTGRAPPVIR